MNKRPLILIILAFVLGEVCVRISSLVAIILAVVMLLLLVCYQIRVSTKSFTRRLYVLPFFILLGAGVMSQELKMSAFALSFEDETEGIIEGIVVDIGRSSSGQTVTIKNPIIQSGNKTYMEKTKLLIYKLEEEGVKIGQKIKVKGQILSLPLPSNPGQFNSKIYYKSRGITYTMFAAKDEITEHSYLIYEEGLRQIRLRLSQSYKTILNERDAGVVMAMVLGEKSYLESEIKRKYQANGIAHMLAISGLHVSLIGSHFFKLLKKAGCSYIEAGLTALILLVSYCMLTGMGSATVRASIMLGVSIIGQVIGRSYDLLTAMSLAAILLLLQYPFSIYDASFLLSFGAIMGIAFIYPMLQTFIKVKNPIFDSMLVSGGIQLFTLPILVYFFYDVAVYSILINLLVIPLMGILLPFAIGGGIVGIFSIPMARVFSVPAIAILRVYDFLCSFFEKLPYYNITVGSIKLWQVVFYYVVVFTILYLCGKEKKRQALFLFFLSIAICFFVRDANLKIVFIDVGQGDSIFIRTPSRKNILVDGGSSSKKNIGQYTLLPVLKYYGSNGLDFVFVSHMDSDHISGIIELFDFIKVWNLILPKTNLVDETYESLENLAIERGTKVIKIDQGGELIINGVKFSCLHPMANTIYTDTNDYSMVLDVTYNQYSMLLTGDLGQDQEEQIQDNLFSLTCLKVGHHGSKTSTGGGFLEKINPKWAVISAGIDNSYGHPHKEVVDRLRAYGAQIYNTSDHGAVTITTDGKAASIAPYLIEKKSIVKP